MTYNMDKSVDFWLTHHRWSMWKRVDERYFRHDVDHVRAALRAYVAAAREYEKKWGVFFAEQVPHDVLP